MVTFNKLYFTFASLCVVAVITSLLVGLIDRALIVVVTFLLYSAIALVLNVWLNKGDS